MASAVVAAVVSAAVVAAVVVAAAVVATVVVFFGSMTASSVLNRFPLPSRASVTSPDAMQVRKV